MKVKIEIYGTHSRKEIVVRDVGGQILAIERCDPKAVKETINRLKAEMSQEKRR